LFNHRYSDKNIRAISLDNQQASQQNESTKSEKIIKKEQSRAQIFIFNTKKKELKRYINPTYTTHKQHLLKAGFIGSQGVLRQRLSFHFVVWSFY